MIERGAIVAEARTWMGTPFHHGQALKGVGCDCIGLVVGVASALGVAEVPAWLADARFRGYARQPEPKRLLAACSEYLDELPLECVQLGDILQYTFAKEPMHFAIVSRTEPRYVIHGYQRAGAVVENGATATFWRLMRAYSFRGVA